MTGYQQVQALRTATGVVGEFYDAAREVGMSTSEDGLLRCRSALSHFLGRPIYQRSQLSRAEWRLCAMAVKSGALVW